MNHNRIPFHMTILMFAIGTFSNFLGGAKQANPTDNQNNSSCSAADAMEVSDYFYNLFEDEEEDFDERKKPFEQFLLKDVATSRKTCEHFSQLITYAKNYFALSPNRYVLLQKIAKKLGTLSSLTSVNVEKIYELYRLADFTGTNIIADAVALYLFFTLTIDYQIGIMTNRIYQKV